MKSLVNAAIQSMAALAAVTGLAIFLLVIMGVTGVEFFKGVLHYRCADVAIFGACRAACAVAALCASRL